LFLEEMVGGAALGLAGGWFLARSLKRLPIEAPLAPILVLTGGLAVFGLAQLIGTSGFLATYLAAVITGATQHRAHEDVEHFFEGMAWLAQIVLFLMPGKSTALFAGCRHQRRRADLVGSPGGRVRLSAAVRV